MKDAGGQISTDNPVLSKHKGLYVRLFRSERSPQTIFQANMLRPKIKVEIAGQWCEIEILQHGDVYQYVLRADGRYHFKRFVLVQGDQQEILPLDEVKKQLKHEFVSVVLPVGIEGLPIYLDALAEHVMNKEKLLDQVEACIGTTLQERLRAFQTG